MLRTRLTVLALVLTTGLAHAGIENAGTTAGNFLSVGTGAGILSMGGATLGGGKDLNAAAWNPATLGFLSSSQYALSHASLALDVSQDWVAASGRLGRSETRWAASALYQNDGTFDGRDAFGAPTGSFNVSNLALGLAVARPFTPDVTAGARIHYLNESLGSASGSGFGMDLGLQARHGAFGFGAAARNIGGKMSYDSGKYDLPGVYGFGASWSDATRGLRFALDANFPHAYYNDVRFGGEWTWQERVALRAGYRMELGASGAETLGGPTFGFGTGMNGLWFDYAFLAGASQSQGEHRFGLTFHPSFFHQRGMGAMGEAQGGAPAEPVAVAPAAEKAVRAAKPAVVAKSEPAKSEPAKAEPAKTEPVAAAEPVAAPSVTVSPEDTGANATARTSEPTAPKLAPTRSVKVPKLAQPRLAPEPAPVASAPAAKAPAEPVAVTVAPAVEPASPAKADETPASSAEAPVAVAPAEAEPSTPVKAAKHEKPAKAEKAPKPAKAAPVADAAAPPLTPPIAKVAATPAPQVVVVRPAPKPEVERPAEVTVEKGETLESIAKKWGTSAAAIMMENNMVRAQVKTGQKLKLPKH